MQSPQIEIVDARPPTLVFLFRLEVTFAPAQELGETPIGGRRILLVEAGYFAGPGLRGTVREGGGDWVLLRRDGVAELDIRFILEAEDEALIYVRGKGIFDMPSDLKQALTLGETIDRDLYYFRTTFTFETGASPHLFLNRLIAVGVGERTTTGMITNIFAVQ